MIKMSPSELLVTNDSKKISDGSTFVAIRGFKLDGKQFIDEAIARGATTIVSDEQDQQEQIVLLQKHPNTAFHFVSDARTELAFRSSAAYSHPSKKLKIIGITGTKGKSTTTHLIDHILRSSGAQTALIGGITNKIINTSSVSSLTTPESDYLHYFFAQCVSAGAHYVTMEVSAHALSLARTHGLEFTAIGFTNVGQDHLDFYTTMENYFAAKTPIFSQLKKNGSAVINLDHDWKDKLQLAAQDHLTNEQTLLLSQHQNFTILSDDHRGLIIQILQNGKKITLHAPSLMGSFNAYNIAMASLICASLGISWSAIAEGVKTFTGTPGRMQLHRLANGARAFVDFAHNPSSMASVLQTLRPLTDHLIVIFGCGGDRDKTKRPLMGALAAQYGDLAIVTDDNPRTEDRHAIINDIVAGIPEIARNKVVIIQPDRRAAIALAAAVAQPSSIIALLGKGHETYYLVGNEKYHFDDFEEVSIY